jgi:hypothetical protein
MIAPWESVDKDQPEISRPYPWERTKMTVCIGAIARAADKNEAIIVSADWQTSSPTGRSETALKMRYLPNGWCCLLSGTDHEANALYNFFVTQFAVDAQVDETNVINLIEKAVAARKRQKAEQYVQGRFAISYSDFLQNGKTWLSPKLFDLASDDIAAMTVGAETVIAGFTAEQEYQLAMVCETGQRGEVKIREHYALAGEGRLLADAALRHREYIQTADFEYALYSVFEAKKFAERVPSVGPSTLIDIMHRDGRRESVTDAGLEFLREEYQKYGPQPVPALTLKKGYFKPS